MNVQTGKGTLPGIVVAAIWSVSAVTSLPGLAVSPILGDLNRIFPSATELEIQMLTSLTSLLVIPFVLLSGRLSVARDKVRLLQAGLVVFLLSGAACLVVRSMIGLIVISCILGIGAGVVIPLSTGLVVDCFTGSYRVRQLGYSSAINNFTLVLATMLAGYLAGIRWNLAFLVYLLPVVSLALSFFLRRRQPVSGPGREEPSHRKTIDRRRLAGLMGLYFAVTFAVLAVVYYLSFLVDRYGYGDDFSGLLIALFFLSIMLPGLVVDRVIGLLRSRTNIVALASIAVGLLLVGVVHDRTMMAVGCMFAGLGYGIMQPIIYDKTALVSPPRSATLALSFVMAVNYLAVLVCPFLIDPVRRLFSTHSERLPFLLNAVLAALLLVWACARRNTFTLGLDPTYLRSR